jgi:outer membrane lipopolysaccharide assembly protein LptE/RlpB
MSDVAPLLLLALAGLLTGGAWSLRQQGAAPVAFWITVFLAVLALAGGVAWLLPEGTFR